MCAQTNRHTLQLALCGGGGCGGIIYIYIYRRTRCTTRTCGARSGSPQLCTSECKALWGEPEPAPFFVCAHAFALIGTRDAVHVRV